MIKLLIRIFVKDYESFEKTSVREAYGVLSGVIGIICNLILFVTKLLIGFMIGSIAITSDAFNNLSDTGSSLVAIVGAKLSSRDADHEHPYGHGRFEYVASLIISFIILLVGFELLKSSFSKALNPSLVSINPIIIVILTMTVVVKLWMYSYNRYIGKLIRSGVNIATAADSLNDVIATSAVIITTIIGALTKIPLDGYAGIIVSLLIMYTGFGIAKDTVNILLGMSPSEETVNKIMELITESESIRGAHDLKVHDYGPGRTIASIHTELSDKTDIVKAHAIIDGLEKKILKELGIDLVIHVDPIGDGQVGPID
ncbi:cation diffusion facilitator family transporter [Fusibacter bizertensis]|jgi:cation diffusion facilitator family transporter|uniref:Cation diffusion facilitator family transporter n=1 Tax=Fusibacter bizertensis TaxID=1488331 RepID=A0ABT6ND11_9FIRM|nr:cation diffusion facilitator family transporter [Fusibacter bizertensis]MDH8678297.1 cation diffusion facilitator family transporter [Fusibacter bizertensis]